MAPLAVALGIGAAGLGASPAMAGSEWGPLEPRPIPGPATTTIAGTLLEGGSTDDGSSTVFLYAEAGEEVVARIATTADTPAGAQVIVTDPSGTVVHDDAVPAAIAGTHLGGAWTAAGDGVWTIEVVDPAPREGDGASFAWDVAVVRGLASVPGRVWWESLAIHTPEQTTVELVAASPDGSLHAVTLDDYDGVDSTVRVDDVGNALAGTCEAAGVSVPMPHSPEADHLGADYWQPSRTDCPGMTVHRLFLDAPAADLPPSTTAWADGRTSDTWLSATYAAPTIDGLAFARDAATGSAGVVSGVLTGSAAEVLVEVDADGDGGYDGSADVRASVRVGDSGAFSWAWDGLDGAGAAVPVVATGVTVRATATQSAAVHVLRIDAEESVGGVSVEALAGPATGPLTMHWDDTLLADSSDARSSRTPQLIGSDPATTSTDGVHGWAAGDARPNRNDGVHGSWGDMRSIDDWAVVDDHAQAVVAVAPLADLRIDKRVDGEPAYAADGSSATLRWTIEVANLGPASATSTLVQDTYPDGVDPASVAVVDGPSTGAFDAASGRWDVGTLAPGATASVSFTAVVATQPGAAATAVNAATVTSPESPWVPGLCEPNDGVEADADRCDVVETPLAPPVPAPPVSAPPVAAPPAVPAVAIPPATELPRTGASPDLTIAAVAATAIAAGLGALLLARRRARRGSRPQSERAVAVASTSSRMRRTAASSRR